MRFGKRRGAPHAAESENDDSNEDSPRTEQGRAARRIAATRTRRRRRIRNAAIVSLTLIVLAVGAGVGYAYHLTHDLHRVVVKGLHKELTSGHEAGTQNILMVGSTSRCALAVQSTAYGICDEGVNGVNSDVIMILHADPAAHRLSLLSIPRDLFIPNARSTGANKIDAGLYQGISQVVAAIQEDFGISIQHAVSLNFDQFANVVNAIGGINLSFPQSLYDAESSLNVQAATCVHLNGTQALEVVRARHLQYQGDSTSPYADDWQQEAESDLARIRRDHEFLRVLASTIAVKGLDNPVTDLSLINSLKADMTFDQSWSVTDMVDLVLDFHSININAVPQLTLPVASASDPEGSGGQLVYQGAEYGDVEFTAAGPDLSTIDQFLNVKPNIDTMTGEPLPAASSVSVSVENGSDEYNQATDAADSLSGLGFHIVGTGDIEPSGDLEETYVYYGSQDATTEAAAEAVAHSMTGSVVMAYDPSEVTDGAQVTVVTGSQFGFVTSASSTTSSTVAPTSTTSTSESTTTTTSPFTSPSAQNIGTPSANMSSLAPWDPRACAAGAVPTSPVPNPT
jgi:polyisoprenyl-teichoic acid--peptidoglycan teichoic acid transferase